MEINDIDSKILHLKIPLGECRKIVALDYDAIRDLYDHIEKYTTWIDDCKKIRTKEILQRARA